MDSFLSLFSFSILNCISGLNPCVYCRQLKQLKVTSMNGCNSSICQWQNSTVIHKIRIKMKIFAPRHIHVLSLEAFRRSEFNLMLVRSMQCMLLRMRTHHGRMVIVLDSHRANDKYSDPFTHEYILNIRVYMCMLGKLVLLSKSFVINSLNISWVLASGSRSRAQSTGVAN